MKTRTLFLTLLISISILLITSGLSFAGSITGCVKNSTGVIYNVQTGDTPAYPCHFLDGDPITWSVQGPQGEQGPPGENGQDGQDGAQGPAGADGALADKVVAYGKVFFTGTSFWGSNNFTVQHVPNTGVYDITMNAPLDCHLIPNPLNKYAPKASMVANAIPLSFTISATFNLFDTYNDCVNSNPTIHINFWPQLDGSFQFQLIGDPLPAS